MSFLSRLFGKRSHDELKPVKVKPLSQRFRLNRLQQKKSWYESEVVVMFENKPLGTIKTKLDGYSRDQVAKRIQDGLSFKVITAHQLKK